MIPVNGYLTLAAGRQLWRMDTTNAPDDEVIQDLIEECSRALDDVTNRHYFPSFYTNSYDVPQNGSPELLFGDDLLELLTFTNGDGSTFASDEYVIYPLNAYPKRWVTILPTSSNQFQTDGGNWRGVLDVAGVWGFHNDIRNAWRSLTTLSAAISDTTTLSASVASSTNLVAGQLIKIDSELFRVSTTATGAVTWDARGINGSTPATHSLGATLYLWEPVPSIVRCAKTLVKFYYDQRFGQGVGGQARITGAGVVITPASWPDSIARLLNGAGLGMPGLA